MTDKKVWTGTGRRKRSSAQARLTLGKGKIVVNGVAVDEYMPYATLVMDIKQPLVATDNEEKFDFVEWVLFDSETEAVYEREVNKLYS